MLGKKDVNMLAGSILKGLLIIAIPVMVMNIVQSLFNIIDMTILSKAKAGGDTEVGAIGTCGVVISLITSLVTGVASGASVVVARYIGKKDEEGVKKAVGTSMVFSVLGGLVLLVIGVCFAEVFLGWINCNPSQLRSAALYFRLYFIGTPILMVYNYCAALLRSTGDSLRPMIYLTISGVVKVGLNFLFVLVFRMQVVGVALATIISWLVAAILGVFTLIKNNSAVKIYRKYLKIYKKELKEMLYLGLPAGMQAALYSVANIIITATVNSFGPDAQTGVSIANTFDGILYQIATAPALAVMPYVSQNSSAGNIKRARRSVIIGTLITIALGASFGAMSAIFSGPLSSIMTDNPNVIKFSQQKMIIVSSTYFICGINEILGAAMRGLRKPIVAMVCTLIFMCGIRFIWVYLVFPLFPTDHALTYLYLIWPIGWVLSILTLLCFYFPTVNRLKRKTQINQKIQQENV